MEINQSIATESSWVIDYTKYKANNPKTGKSIDHKPLTCGERIKKRAFKVKTNKIHIYCNTKVKI